MDESDVGKKVKVVLRGKRNRKNGTVVKKNGIIGVLIAGVFYTIEQVHTLAYAR